MLALRHRGSLGRALVSSCLESRRRVGASLVGGVGAARTAISASHPSQSFVVALAYSSYAGRGLARQQSESPVAVPVAPYFARRAVATLPPSADDATTTAAVTASSSSESVAVKSPSKRKSRAKSKASTPTDAAASSEATAADATASSSGISDDSDAIGSEDGDDTIVQSTSTPFVAVTSPAADAPPGTRRWLSSMS